MLLKILFHNAFNFIIMAFLICMVPVCPIRADASHRSEQVSQLLFGEICELLERTKDFVRVRVLFDNYDGWCQSAQLEQTEIDIFNENTMLAADWVNTVAIRGQRMNIPFGSSLTFLNDEGLAKKHDMSYNGSFIDPAANTISISLIKQFTHTFLNTSYIWGGRSVFGIDCSGFTQLVFKCLNVPLLRDAYQQATQGEEVGSLQEAACGDIAFFDNEAGRITHTGVILDPNTIIHASGKVRIDTLDESGIINADNGLRTHNLKIVKRLINSVGKD